MSDYRDIKIEKENEEAVVIDSAGFDLIGKGSQGAVFKITEDRCVKIFIKRKYCKKESRAYKAARLSSIVPKAYEFGENYIVMELLKGQTLYDYFMSKPTISKTLASRLLAIFKEMKKIGFTRIDASLLHIYINEKGVIKVIDHFNSLRQEYDIPVRFFDGLKEFDLLIPFMNHIKDIDSSQYGEWNNSPELIAIMRS